MIPYILLVDAQHRQQHIEQIPFVAQNTESMNIDMGIVTK